MARRSSVQWMLARLGASDEGHAELRRASYAQVERIARPWVRRRVQGAVTEAALSSEHALSEGHLHRVALLVERGRGVDVDTIEAVRIAFDAELAREPAERGRPYATWTLGSLFLLGLAAVVLLVALPDHVLDRTLLPASADAFEHGGRPRVGSAAERELFVEQLPRFVVALDDARREDTPEVRAALESAERDLLDVSRSVLGQLGTTALDAIVAQSRALVDTRDRASVDNFLRSLDAFNQTVEQLGLGYYLDAEVVPSAQGQRVYIASFGVERVIFLKAGESQVRVLRLARRDGLNFARNVLGFTRPHVRDALVLHDRIDDWLIRDVLPAVVEDGRFPISGDTRGQKVALRLPRLEQRAAQEARRELAVLATGCRAFAKTAELFKRRADAFRDLSDQVSRHGMQVAAPYSYDMELVRFEGARSIAQPGTFRELEEVESALEEDVHRTCFISVREVLAASIDRHETQHRLDFMAESLDRLPEELELRVGPLEVYGLRNAVAQRTLAEASAYLSELARGPELVKVNLAMLAQHVLDARRWGSAEYYAALVIFDGLALQLGTAPVERRVAKPTDRVASVLGLAFALDDSELARAAKRLWEQWMGKPLLPLQRQQR